MIHGTSRSCGLKCYSTISWTMDALVRHPKGREAFDTACRWDTQFRSLIQFIAPRSPLPLNDSPLDYRHYRTFIEALHFVSPDA